MFSPEVQKIKEDFDKVITYSQNIPNPQTEQLFELWLERKKDIIEAFGGKFIYEYPKKITLLLGDKEKNQRIIRFIDSVINNWDCEELGSFIEIQSKGFFNNITVEDFTTHTGKIIKKGTKLVKSFKYFIPEGRRLEDIQNEASRIIQEDKIEGTFCMSVHPLDFLSSSETTYNWRSCHALDGEYCAGNLSYIMDRSTIICYLKGDKDEKLPHFPEDVKWNSKKWRVLLFLSNSWDMIFAGRQYPFETKTGLDFILKQALPKTAIIKETPSSNWSDWCQTKYADFELNGSKVSLGPHILMSDGLKKMSCLISDTCGSKHYNDLLYSSCYDPFYCFNRSKNLNKTPLTSINTTSFAIGAYTYCLRCGKAEVLDPCGSMMCADCELKYGDSESDLFAYCDCCGSRFYADDACYVGDEVFCEDCYDKYTIVCECCGEAVYKDDVIYDEEHDIYICSRCNEDRNS